MLVGRLIGGALRYEAVNACIRFVGSLHGCHVVTVEHLAGKDGKLHPVQQAMVDCHGSQCGFCTPGFVMSLYGLWMANDNPSRAEIEIALQGNLCRCTATSRSLRRQNRWPQSGRPSALFDPIERDRAEIMAKLWTIRAASDTITVAKGNDRAIIPARSMRWPRCWPLNPPPPSLRAPPMSGSG